jgi:hypothetical protein
MFVRDITEFEVKNNGFIIKVLVHPPHYMADRNPVAATKFHRFLVKFVPRRISRDIAKFVEVTHCNDLYPPRILTDITMS